MSLGDYGSHYPILAAAVAKTTGPVLELGAGHWSTPMLHYMCREWRQLITAETDFGWLKQFVEGYSRHPIHEFHHVTDWTQWDVLEKRAPYGVAFVDCAPGEIRHELIRRLQGRAHFIVAHDSERDYNTGANYMYERVTPLFKYVSEWRRYRPYTLILSNVEPFVIEECDKVWRPPHGSA